MESLNSLDLFCVGAQATIRDAFVHINRNSKGIVLLVDRARRLIGTVTDGGLRRAVFSGDSLDAPLADLLARKENSEYTDPVTAKIGTGSKELLLLMTERGVRQIPLVDDEGHVEDLVLLDDLVPRADLQLEAVILAGGEGTSVEALTEDLPKAMLPVGDKPLMELSIERLRQAGIRRVNIATHYKTEKIVEHFGDGGNFGVDLNYVNEDEPLGTAGALGLIEMQEPLLVINGDILTQVDFRAMLRFHKRHQADLTMGVRRYDFQLPYGLFKSEGMLVN